MQHMTSSSTRVACGLVTLLCAGCVSGPRTFHANADKADKAEMVLCSSEEGCTSTVGIVQGRPNMLIDGAGWVLGIPRKLILWNRRVDNHDVEPETVSDVATFAEAHQLQDVCIRVNQYAPLDEWDRLQANKRVSPGWRYTLGTLSLVSYTLLPGRLFGGDQYNPYTDSVYVYSDVPALAMEATAYAADVRGRQYPGTYAAVNQLQFVSIWHETVNTQDTLAYLRSNGTVEQQKEGLKVLYPNYGASVGSAIGGGAGVQLALAVVGHVSGRVEASRLPTADTDTALMEVQERDGVGSIRLVSSDRDHEVLP